MLSWSLNFNQLFLADYIMVATEIIHVSDNDDNLITFKNRSQKGHLQ